MASPAKAAAAHDSQRELVLTRVFDAPPQAVFEAWTDPAQMAQWFGPPNVKAEVLEMQAHPGGRYRLSALNSEGAIHTVGGVYREVSPPSRLVFTWGWETPMNETVDPATGKGTEMLITVTFKAKGKQTEMTLHQVNFPSDDSRARHDHGWSGSFEKLSAYLAKSTATRH